MITPKNRQLTLKILLLLLFPVSGFAQDFDCAAYENFPGLEPEGYAENCLVTGESAVTCASDRR